MCFVLEPVLEKSRGSGELKRKPQSAIYCTFTVLTAGITPSGTGDSRFAVVFIAYELAHAHLFASNLLWTAADLYTVCAAA